MTLRDMHWDGHRLRLQAEADVCVEVDIDGSFFAALQSDAQGLVEFAFAFSPNGTSEWTLRLRTLQTSVQANVRLGEPGLRAALAVSTLQPLHIGAALAPADAARVVVIVIPVYNAADAVRTCLDSVLAHSSGAYRLVVIDDASPDAAIAPLLASYSRHAHIGLLRNETNRGFTFTANRGIEAAEAADVILLNADTEVAAGWLTGLRRAAYASADTGSATAVSDNAGAFSVPELERENALPVGWNFTDAARAVRQFAGTCYPHLPTGNGFCMYLKRAALKEVGNLDESAFPQGYGEENDWSQRAQAAGWRHVIAGDVLVRHARSASFGHERRRALGDAGMAVLRERWPHYEAEVGATLLSFERRVLDWRVRRAYAHAKPLLRQLWLEGADTTAVDVQHWRLRHDNSRVHLERFDMALAAWQSVESAADAEGAFFTQSFRIERTLLQWLQKYAIERVRGESRAWSARLSILLAALAIARD
jgi:GT2 family glycosyltransferase